MKNLKISMKLMISFLVVIALSVIVGIVGIIGMGRIEHNSEMMYETYTTPLPDVAKSLEYLQRLRSQLRNAMLNSGNAERMPGIASAMQERYEQFEY